MNTWHANPTDLAAYAAGEGDPLLAASVETHLLRCADCRAVLAGTLADRHPGTPGPETERRWADLTAVVDRPAASPAGPARHLEPAPAHCLAGRRPAGPRAAPGPGVRHPAARACRP